MIPKLILAGLVGVIVGMIVARLLLLGRALAAPPATKRQLARAARANRADLRAVERTAAPFKPRPSDYPRADHSDLPPPIDNFEHLDTIDMENR